MKSKLVLAGAVVAILVLIAYGIGCAGEELPASSSGPVTNFVSLKDNLRQAGATVEPAGEVTQPFFSVQGKVLTVNGSDVQVFEYENTTTAATEAVPKV